MRDLTFLVVVAAFVIALIIFGIWREMTRWNDCRAADRSWPICILMLGH